MATEKKRGHSFPKGNKFGNRFKPGESGNPGGIPGGIPKKVRSAYASIESGLKHAGIVLDLVDEVIQEEDTQKDIKDAFRACITSCDAKVFLPTMRMVAAFMPKEKREAMVTEFQEYSEIDKIAIVKSVLASLPASERESLVQAISMQSASIDVDANSVLKIGCSDQKKTGKQA
jgi:hypothetical protein